MCDETEIMKGAGNQIGSLGQDLWDDHWPFTQYAKSVYQQRGADCMRNHAGNHSIRGCGQQCGNTGVVLVVGRKARQTAYAKSLEYSLSREPSFLCRFLWKSPITAQNVPDLSRIYFRCSADESRGADSCSSLFHPGKQIE
jgi:hypothetical protein